MYLLRSAGVKNHIIFLSQYNSQKEKLLLPHYEFMTSGALMAANNSPCQLFLRLARLDTET